MFCHINIKYIFLAIAVCCFVNLKGYSQDKDIPAGLYKASTIPDSLKEDANSVLRYSMKDFKVEGPGKAVKRVHTIVTVLNEKASDEAGIALPYNKKFSTVSSFDMRIYDADGKLLKKYHKGDMYEHAAEDYESIITDDRIMTIEHTIASYPTTVEMDYEIDDNSLIDLGGWLLQEPEQSVQNSSFHLEIGSDAGFRFRNKNTSISPKKTISDKTDHYVWQVSNLKAYKPEEGSMGWRFLAGVSFAANKFNYYGYPGDFSTWQSFGKWIQNLNGDGCSLSADRIQAIKKMTDTIKTDKEKVRFLYKYMQQSMRYVNIKLGIGGLKPFPATFVDEKKYGDCKALSNYMKALLKAVDINSYYTIINSGTNEEPADFSFPHNDFDHVILCVPLKNDTTWLECTSNTEPFGHLGTFTENRNALIITEDGGKLISTPKSVAKANQFNSIVHISLNPDGGAKASVKILSTGEYRFEYVGLAAAKLDQQKEFLIRELNMKQPSAFEFKDAPDKDGLKELNINLEYDKLCDVATGDKQFYRPHVFDLWDVTVPSLEKRKTDYYFNFPMQKSCVTTIDLPDGFEVEALPANASLKFTYGNYEIKYVYNKDKNQVVGTAKFILNTQVIPAAKYNEMQQYMDDVAKAQNKKLVIHKKA